MPLIKSASRKALSQNIEAETKAGKPQNQAIAIGYDIQRRNKRKKMAEGGIIDSLVSTVKSSFEDDKPADKKSSDYHNRDPKKSKAEAFVKGFNGDEYAKGGVIKKQSIKRPSMVPSSVIKARSREEMMMAEGGMINDEVSMKQAEDDMMEQPAMLEQDNDQMRPPEKQYMAAKMADGGMVSDEEDMEHHDSIAAAIMARRQRMAEGGMVDIMSNAEEEPNQYYGEDEAILKENYDQDMEDVSQPMDSNEHSDNIDSDEHDKISRIRMHMNKQRQSRMR